MIRIFHIITKLELGGAQLNTINTCLYLSKNNYDTYLLAGDGRLSKMLAGTSINYIPLKYMTRAIHPIKDLLAFLELIEYVKKIKPDIIHTHSSKAGILGRLLKLLFPNIFVIHTVHGWSFNKYINPIANKIYILCETIASYMTNLYITVAKSDIIKGLNENIGKKYQYITVRSGVDFNKYYNIKKSLSTDTAKKFLGFNNKHFVIGTISCFKPQKGLYNFIEIANLIINKYKMDNIKFVIVGDGWQRLSIEKQINKYRLGNAVSLLGWRNYPEKILRAFDLFVLTSFWEGLPQSLLQALLLDIPSVISNVDGNKELIIHKETGFLIDPNNINDYVNTIKSLIEDKSYYNKIKNNVTKFIVPAEFSIDTMLDNLDNIYNSIYAKIGLVNN